MAQIQCFNSRKDSELWLLLLMYGLDKKFCVLILQFLPLYCFSFVSTPVVTGPVSQVVAADGVNITETHCQQASLPINQPISSLSAHHSQHLFLSANLSSNDLIRVTLTLAGSCAGTVNEVAHCDEWMGDGFPWWNSPTCTRQTFG